MFIIGMVLFLFASALFAIILGGDVQNFIDLPSILFISIPLLAVLIATHSLKIFYEGLRAVILPREPLSEELRGQAASLFRLLSKTTALVTAIGFLICLVNILMSLDFSDNFSLYSLGANISAALVLPLYGLTLIATIFEPLVFSLKKRRDTTIEGRPRPNRN